MAEDKEFLPQQEQTSEDGAVRRVRTRRIPTASTDGVQATLDVSVCTSSLTRMHPHPTTALHVGYDLIKPTTATRLITEDTIPPANAPSTMNAIKQSDQVGTIAISTTEPTVHNLGKAMLSLERRKPRRLARA